MRAKIMPRPSRQRLMVRPGRMWNRSVLQMIPLKTSGMKRATARKARAAATKETASRAF